MWKWKVRDETRHDTLKRVAKRSAFMYIVTRLMWRHLWRSFLHNRTKINIQNL